jgi:hypothetical protein
MLIVIKISYLAKMVMVMVEIWRSNKKYENGENFALIIVPLPAVLRDIALRLGYRLGLSQKRRVYS